MRSSPRPSAEAVGLLALGGLRRGILLLSALLFRDSSRPVSCRMRIKATSSPWCSFPTGRHCNGPTRCSARLEQYFLANQLFTSTDALAGQNFVFSTRGSNQRDDVHAARSARDQRKRPDQHAKALIGDAYKEFAINPEGADSRLQCAVHQRSGGDRRVFGPGAGSVGRRFSKFSATTQEFLAKVRQDSAIWCARVPNFRVTSPRLYANVDRERAKRSREFLSPSTL